MKKLMILAMAAILSASMIAQEQKTQKTEAGKSARKEQKMSKEEQQKRQLNRTEHEIKRLSRELYMSDEQTVAFAKTYREYMAERAKLDEKFKVKFAKDLNERQVEAVMESTRGHGPKDKGHDVHGKKVHQPGEIRDGRGPKQKAVHPAHTRPLAPVEGEEKESEK